MNPVKPSLELIAPEVTYVTSRSGGPGGQNVNKVNSKVTLRWDIDKSVILSEDQRQLIKSKLASRISADGVLILVAQEKRSQLQNKEVALARLDELLVKAFTVKKARKAGKIPKSIKRARLESKRKLSEKKQLRKKIH